MPRHSLYQDVAAGATIAAVGRAIGDVSVTKEGDAAVAAGAGVDLDGALVDEEGASIVCRGWVEMVFRGGGTDRGEGGRIGGQ